jgi:hypothetical protein
MPFLVNIWISDTACSTIVEARTVKSGRLMESFLKSSKRCFVAVGQVFYADALFLRLQDGFVLDIGERYEAGYVVAEVFEVPLQDVFEEKRAVVADVRPLVRGGAAGVHFDVGRLQWLEGFSFKRQVVMEAKHVPAPLILLWQAAAGPV